MAGPDGPGLSDDPFLSADRACPTFISGQRSVGAPRGPDAMTTTSTHLPSDLGGKDLGVFMPIANGGWIISSSTPPLDGSYAYNRKVAELAELHGLDFIMAMSKLRGFGGATEHWRYSMESQILMAALAAVTSRVKVWATVHTLLQNPAVTAKMMTTLDHVSGGRAGLNVVSGSFKDEFEQMGAWRDDLGHDERYAFAEEWVHVIKRLWSEPSVTHDGKYFQLKDCQSDPKPSAIPVLSWSAPAPRHAA
ncbi:LLM class flavin-dependent oxidoreductase [Brevundimonas sp. SL130]|uniref:LLM class flavin-dependent oxidoreductase n=1 Tax=Brevundimonas sp. SL130 TaxID=2995143 RepID=UPI00226D3876|nr:LLM class flavin-dependent oxidoreductase [Brevundimonas sp. SL130]WAC58492.1 LLM class flavin-dependent oxidoreductase [Brevundimonas sp. SL130]